MEETNSKEAKKGKKRRNLLNNSRSKLRETMWNPSADGFDLIEDSIRSNKKKIFPTRYFPRCNASSKQIYLCLAASTKKIETNQIFWNIIKTGTKLVVFLFFYLLSGEVRTSFGKLPCPSVTLTPVAAIAQNPLLLLNLIFCKLSKCHTHF